MQRRLTVMRHAKSAWDTDAPTDHERPLNKRGKRDAPRVAARLAELGWAPQIVLSSDSVRTQQTWARMSGAFERVVVCFLPTFYHAGVGAVCEALEYVPEQFGSVMVVGHNPGWEELVEYLTGRVERITTANAALLSCEAPTWAAPTKSAGQWSLEQVLRPKEL